MRGGVFVCHAAEDAGTAQRVVAALEAANVPCWIAPRDIEAGQNWAEAILAGIAAAPAMVLVFSAAANGSEHVPRELGVAVERGLPIIPVRLEQAAPSPRLLYFIGQAQWLEAGGVGAQQWESPLVRAVRHAVSGHQTPPTQRIQTFEDKSGSTGAGRPRKLWLWAGAAAVVLVAGLLVVLLTRSGRGGEEETAAGSVPEGRAGMASLFPQLKEEHCDPVDPPGMKVKAEVYLCSHVDDEDYQVRYSRWEDGVRPLDFYTNKYSDAEDWVVKGQKVGERWTYRVLDNPDLSYRWSAAFNDLAFSVDIEAATNKARDQGIGDITRWAPTLPDDQ